MKPRPAAVAEMPLPDQQPASLSARAYQVILRRILKGAVPMGGELSRRRLAAELGMSILPVAEALQRLQNEGIVETQPRVGTRVRVPTPTDVRERYEIREALESQTARLFCRVATDADRADLRRLAERVDQLYSRYFEGAETDPEFLYQVQETHAAFHVLIASVGGCQALRTMLETNQVLTFNWLYYVAASLPVLPARFHAQLAEALCTKDEESADRAMRAHVRYGIEHIIRRMQADLPAAASAR
ncbi:MAG TPA: GntR family transcriptional regulator [Bryobacteraceae bacterium]|nr:GntR family transcriptional regulator [Bryobacteraceae bacterium]